MKENKPQTNNKWLPMFKYELDALGVDMLDFVLVTGDAYIDHPSFGAAIIGRTLEAHGYTVGIIAQPSWQNTDDFTRLGRPRLGFLVTAGNIDSLVNHYTSAKKRRSEDLYSPGAKSGLRPDRASIVYCNRIREAYKRVPIIIGGIEASLRRFAHYDYWDNAVRHSILADSGADILVYGMGERAIVEIADALAAGMSVDEITYVAGTCYMASTLERVYDYKLIGSYNDVKSDKKEYAQTFNTIYREQDAIRGRRLVQPHEKGFLVANPPSMPLSQSELDNVYELPYTRKPHPSYKEHIPALDEVEFSLTSCRGCFGACSFCALTMHQGRTIQSRSHASLIREAQLLTHMPTFKGYIHDVGGPSANFRQPSCKKQLKSGVCADRQCLSPSPCPNLEVSHSDYVALLKELRGIEGVKKVFVRSGIRYDYVMYDKSDAFMRELIAHHISGQLKVAPEHIDDRTLDLMGKPHAELFNAFCEKYKRMNAQMNKEQYIVPYFMSSHPGSDLNSAIALAQYLKKTGLRPEQVQDFYPTPCTLSTAMYYTGLDPRTMKPVYVPRSPDEKAMQRALMQFFMPQYRSLARKALKKAYRDDLIGFGKDALVPPENADKRGGSHRAQTVRSAKSDKGGRARQGLAGSRKNAKSSAHAPNRSRHGK